MRSALKGTTPKQPSFFVLLIGVQYPCDIVLTDDIMLDQLDLVGGKMRRDALGRGGENCP